MKKITSIVVLLLALNLTVQAEIVINETISQSFHLLELFLFILALSSISYFSFKRIENLTGIYRIIVTSFFAGILGGILGVISICSTNIHYNETNLIILAGALTGMFLAMALSAFYRAVGLFIGALIGFTLGSTTSTIIVFHKIPWNIIIWGSLFVITSIIIMNYKLKKVYN